MLLTATHVSAGNDLRPEQVIAQEMGGAFVFGGILYNKNDRFTGRKSVIWFDTPPLEIAHREAMLVYSKEDDLFSFAIQLAPKEYLEKDSCGEMLWVTGNDIVTPAYQSVEPQDDGALLMISIFERNEYKKFIGKKLVEYRLCNKEDIIPFYIFQAMQEVYKKATP